MGVVYDYHVRKVCQAGELWHYHYDIQTDNYDPDWDPSEENETCRDYVIERIAPVLPTCVGNSPSDLVIRTNVSLAIVNDDTTITPDSTYKKFIKMSLARDNASGSLTILSFEKTTGDYSGTPVGKTIIQDLKEFSVVASGTELVEEQSWL